MACFNRNRLASVGRWFFVYDSLRLWHLRSARVEIICDFLLCCRMTSPIRKPILVGLGFYLNAPSSTSLFYLWCVCVGVWAVEPTSKAARTTDDGRRSVYCSEAQHNGWLCICYYNYRCKSPSPLLALCIDGGPTCVSYIGTADATSSARGDIYR